MKNGYKVIWTSHARNEVEETLEYLQENWSHQSIIDFSRNLDYVVNLLTENPFLFPASGKNSVRKALVDKYNVIYYSLKQTEITILSVFSSRRNPGKRKLE